MNVTKTTVIDCENIPGKSDAKLDACSNFKSWFAEKSGLLCGPKLPASGRSVRQIIITVGAMKNATRAERRATLRRLVRAANKWFKAYDRVVSWVAFSTDFGMEPRSNDYAAAVAANSKTGEI